MATYVIEQRLEAKGTARDLLHQDNPDRHEIRAYTRVRGQNKWGVIIKDGLRVIAIMETEGESQRLTQISCIAFQCMYTGEVILVGYQYLKFEWLYVY